MKDIVKEYIAKCNEKNHRYLSWEHCYEAFGNSNNSIDYLALHLAFYLASWGMYRGSTELLQKDYKIHIPTVENIKPLALRRDCVIEADKIQEVMNEVKNRYKNIGIKASKTLQTKVLLGTLGCIPAFDRFFVDGWKLKEKSIPTISAICEFVKNHVRDIEECQLMIDRNIQYPPMKIVDMYFWQLGYNDYSQKKKVGKNKTAQ